jgi:hypothetical protein
MNRRVGAFVRLAAINALVFASIVVAIEGLASVFLVVRDVVVVPWVAQPYTRYDPDLGWVNKPNVRLQNMFGTGAWLQTNGQGFRASGDVTPAVAPGRYRVICSGDSFTFGDGVDNDHTRRTRRAHRTGQPRRGRIRRRPGVSPVRARRSRSSAPGPCVRVHRR